MACLAYVFGLRPSTRPIGLALQGGGAHGAYTWGVLDALLERTRHPIAAVSGTSAGAVNAVVMTHGLLLGGRDGAREALTRFWTALGNAVPWDALGLVAGNGERFSTAGRLLMRWTQALMPTQPKALRVDPLRDLLTKQVDFERLRHRDAPRLYVAATHANSGRLRVFENDELSVDAVLASACLPMLQPAIQIDGEPYWDGGYSANPAIYPLIHDADAADVMLVVLSPWQWDDAPEHTRRGSLARHRDRLQCHVPARDAWVGAGHVARATRLVARAVGAALAPRAMASDRWSRRLVVIARRLQGHRASAVAHSPVRSRPCPHRAVDRTTGSPARTARHPRSATVVR